MERKWKNSSASMPTENVKLSYKESTCFRSLMTLDKGADKNQSIAS